VAKRTQRKPVKIAAAVCALLLSNFLTFSFFRIFSLHSPMGRSWPAGRGSPLAFGSENWLPVELFQSATDT
jgi:hypothetical protein